MTFMAQAPDNSNAFDADAQQIGQSYATALIGAAENAGKLEQVVEELEAFVAECLVPLPQVAAALESPRLPVEAKVSIIDKAVAGKVSQEFHNFLRVLARHGRFDCIRVIVKEARKQLTAKLGRVAVLVRSAVALDDAMLQRIAEKLKTAIGSDVELHAEVDPDLIGGLVIRIGDTVFDGSIARRLLRMREKAVRKTHEVIRHQGERFVSDQGAA